MQDLLPARPVSDRNRPAWRACVSRLKARRSFLAKCFIKSSLVKRGNKKKTGGPARSSRLMENVDGLAYRATDFDFADGNVTRAITAKVWRELTPPQAWRYDRESSASTLGGALRAAAFR